MTALRPLALAILVALGAAACTASMPTPTATATDVDSAEVDNETAAIEPSAAVPDPTPTAAIARSQEQQSAVGTPTPPPNPAPDSIRDIDFQNFTYGTDAYVEEVTVVDGEFSIDNGDDGRFWFGVTDVDIGDLDADGVEEALITTSWNGGGTGYFDSVSLFRFDGTGARPAGRVAFGDRADGGIFDTAIVDGVGEVWSFRGNLGACCPNQIITTRLAVGSHSMIAAESTQARRFTSFQFLEDNNELKFVPGTSSAVVAIYPSRADEYLTFDAAAGQFLDIEITSGEWPATIELVELATGEIVASAGGPTTIELPSDGLYELAFRYVSDERAERTVLEVGIHSDNEPEPEVSWQPMLDQVVVTPAPEVVSSVAYPRFSSPQPGTDEVNARIMGYVQALAEPWIEDVTESSEPQDDSVFEVAYDVALVAGDLVSVHFNYYDYVCCRPYPNYGQRALLLDLRSGEEVALDEIIDMSRLAELQELWVTTVDSEIAPDPIDVRADGSPLFDSLTVVAGGIDIGTDRGSLGGGSSGTTTFLSFGQLGDLVRPGLVARLS